MGDDEHMMSCTVCGQPFDMRHLDQVMLHEGDHKPRVATGIVGEIINGLRDLSAIEIALDTLAPVQEKTDG